MENKKLKSFKDLAVWQKAADLAVLIYEITEKFPRSETYGIVNQMRRAVISISSNLAEGFKRIHQKEKLQFYNIAYSSTSELESQIEISKKLGFLSENDYQKLLSAVVEVSKMINGLIKSLNPKSYILNSCAGQSLVEVLIAVSIGALIVGSAAGALIFTVRSNQQSRATDTASTLSQEILDQIRSVSEGNWQSLYNLTAKGGPTQSCTPYCYYLNSSLNINTGSEQKVVNNITYTRYFAVENVYRDVCGSGIMCDTDSNSFRDVACGGDNSTTPVESSCTGSQTGVLEDPSTQKVTAKVTWLQGSDTAEVLVSEYLTRSKNEVNQFSDWSGSTGTEGPVTRPSKNYFGQSGLDTTTTPGSLKLTP